MKVINWLFGGFFRTIGRTLAFLVMGALLYYILSINDIGVQDLFFENVKADTQSDAIWATYYTDPLKQNALPSSGNFQYFQPTTGTGNNMTTQLIYFSPTQVRGDYFDYITIPFTITGRQYTNDANYSDREIICEWDYEEVAGGGYTASAYDCNWYASGTFSSPAPISIQMDISLTSTTSQAQSPCEIQNNKVKCMLLNNVNFDTMIVNYSLTNQNSDQPIRINFSHVVGKYQSAVDRQQQAIEGVQEGIQNQTEQQHQDSQNTQNAINNGINQTIETITDNELNDTEIENQLQFEVPSTSMGPFSGFITLPLTWVQNILAANQVCHKLELPLPFINKTLDLPCMQDFWSRMGLLSSLIQLCWLAVVGVRIFNGLYLLVVDIKSPNANADQLTKIRSWEL